VPIQAHATREASSGEPIDRSYLARFTLGNAALEREILELFAAQMPLYVAQLRTAANSKAWMLAAHTIKGSALAVGAQRLADLAQRAERLDVDAASADGQHIRQQAADAVAEASSAVCGHIACLFATD
jgi:HPt (histidine-containing phosphotransfer) domain-containing protein